MENNQYRFMPIIRYCFAEKVAYLLKTCLLTPVQDSSDLLIVTLVALVCLNTRCFTVQPIPSIEFFIMTGIHLVKNIACLMILVFRNRMAKKFLRTFVLVI